MLVSVASQVNAQSLSHKVEVEVSQGHAHAYILGIEAPAKSEKWEQARTPTGALHG